jgi:hypothetical protein
MKIEFIPTSLDVEEFIPHPKPSAQYFPKWYKEKSIFDGKKIKDVLQTGSFGIKSCMPFLDSMINGYIQETWCDIFIDNDKDTGEVKYFYSSMPQILDVRHSVNVEVDERHYPYEFVWKMPWSIKMPKGYSVLFTHPLNHTELPFSTLSGIIDFDVFTSGEMGNLPFFIKNNFSGLIPAGTPMYQMIPIKRESWTSSICKFDEKKLRKYKYIKDKNFYGVYKKIFRQKKFFK